MVYKRYQPTAFPPYGRPRESETMTTLSARDRVSLHDLVVCINYRGAEDKLDGIISGLDKSVIPWRDNPRINHTDKLIMCYPVETAGATGEITMMLENCLAGLNGQAKSDMVHGTEDGYVIYPYCHAQGTHFDRSDLLALVATFMGHNKVASAWMDGRSIRVTIKRGPAKPGMAKWLEDAVNHKARQKAPVSL